jgi:hypothetical protein
MQIIEMQMTKLSVIFAIAEIINPLRKSSKVSALKVEKVLKPPQNPTAIKNRNELCVSVLADVKPKKSPSMSELIIFARSVPKGKEKSEMDAIHLPIP